MSAHFAVSAPLKILDGVADPARQYVSRYGPAPRIVRRTPAMPPGSAVDGRRLRCPGNATSRQTVRAENVEAPEGLQFKKR